MIKETKTVINGKFWRKKRKKKIERNLEGKYFVAKSKVDIFEKKTFIKMFKKIKILIDDIGLNNLSFSFPNLTLSLKIF